MLYNNSHFTFITILFNENLIQFDFVWTLKMYFVPICYDA